MDPVVPVDAFSGPFSGRKEIGAGRKQWEGVIERTDDNFSLLSSPSPHFVLYFPSRRRRTSRLHFDVLIPRLFFQSGPVSLYTEGTWRRRLYAVNSILCSFSSRFFASRIPCDIHAKCDTIYHFPIPRPLLFCYFFTIHSLLFAPINAGCSL